VDRAMGIVCLSSLVRGKDLSNGLAQVSSGLLPDGKHFVQRAREEAAEWRNVYKAPIPVASLADRMGSYVQLYTMYNSVRPFGISAIVGGWVAVSILLAGLSRPV